MTNLEKFLAEAEELAELGLTKKTVLQLIEIANVLRQDMQSIANIDQGKLKNLAEASLRQANAIAGGDDV